MLLSVNLKGKVCTYFILNSSPFSPILVILQNHTVKFKKNQNFKNCNKFIEEEKNEENMHLSNLRYELIQNNFNS